MDKYNYAIIYNNQALSEHGFTTELMSKGHYYPSDKAQKYVDSLFSNNKVPLLLREKYWSGKWNKRTYASIFARIYAVYIENPQWFGDSPEVAVMSSILSARNGMMHFQKEDSDKYVKISRKLVESTKDSFHEAIYSDSLLLISLKKSTSSRYPKSQDNLWAKAFGWT